MMTDRTGCRAVLDVTVKFRFEMTARSLSLWAPAKVNLYLEIVGDRPDGFHELSTIFQSIGVMDRVTVSVKPGMGHIHVSCANEAVPNDPRNLAHKAAALMVTAFPDAAARLSNIDIVIEKNIPVAAGLAGGSADAAATLVGLDMLWDLGLTRIELQDLAAKFGSDISFCVGGGTALATGRGEVLDALPGVSNLWVVLGKYQDLSISTPWAYKRYRELFEAEYARDYDTQKSRHDQVRSGAIVRLLSHLAKGDRTDLADLKPLLRNDLERSVLPDHEKIQTLRACFSDHSDLGAMMSGSGPTVFAIAADEAEANRIRTAVRADIPDKTLGLWTAPFSAQGIHLDTRA